MADNITQFESVGGFSGAKLFVSGGATFSGTLTATTAAVGTNTTQVATTAFVQNELDQQIRRGTGTTTNGVGSVTISPALTTLENVQLTVKNGSGALTAGLAVPLVVGASPTGSGFNVYGDVTQSVSFYWTAVGR